MLYKVTRVRIPRGKTKDFSIEIRSHQNSTLSGYLFDLVLNVLIKDIQKNLKTYCCGWFSFDREIKTLNFNFGENLWK